MFTVNEHLRIGAAVFPRVPDDFELRPYERIQLDPMTPNLGAVVGNVGLADDLDDHTRAELHQALLEWKVLFFRVRVMDRISIASDVPVGI